MAKESNSFRCFCKDAFGEDFSQDGFSDTEQIDRILPYIPQKNDVHILDIGCGNGKMLGYLQKKTKAFIHGFDYSQQAIKTAQALFPERAEFREGIIGQTEYPDEAFDVIISMDTLYFAADMTAFVAQVKKWLKKDGVFFVGYQEGEVIPKTPDAHTTMLAEALRANGMTYEATDLSRQTYLLLKKKRQSAIKHRSMFKAEGHRQWFEMLLGQTACSDEPFDRFKEKMARYIYVIRK
jgi:2-polyprenyl-3-methyl-5-hydroxy-6-metoxy-1,4-benzoquinol methylase